MKVAELKASDPTLEQELAMSGKKLNTGELFSEIIKLTTDNDKIITDVSPEEMAAGQGIDPMTNQPIQQPMQPGMPQVTGMPVSPGVPEAPQEQAMDVGAELPVEGQEQQPISQEEMQANVEAIMQQYGVDENMQDLTHRLLLTTYKDNSHE
jgi:hypothetical protein